MYVLSIAKGFDKVGVAAQVGHDAQFDLRVVRRDYHSVRAARDEGLADLLSPFRSDRDVLEVWLRRAQASGGCEGLVEGGVYLASHRRYVAGERVYIGGQEFADSSVFKYLIDYRMLVGKRAQCVFVCGVAVSDSALRLDLRVELELFEYQGADLDRGEYVEIGLSGHFPYALLDLVEFRSECRGISEELDKVDPDAFHFHSGQDFQQGFLHPVVEGVELKCENFFPYRFAEKQHGRGFGVLFRSFGIFRYRIEKRQGFFLFRSLDAVLDIDVEICSGENVDLVTLLRIDQVMHQFDVHELSVKGCSVVGEDVALVFQVIAIFCDGAVGDK